MLLFFKRPVHIQPSLTYGAFAFAGAGISGEGPLMGWTHSADGAFEFGGSGSGGIRIVSRHADGAFIFGGSGSGGIARTTPAGDAGIKFGGDGVARAISLAAGGIDGALVFGGSGSGGVYLKSAIKTADGAFVVGGSGSGGLYSRHLAFTAGDGGFVLDGSAQIFHVPSGGFVFGGSGSGGAIHITRATGDGGFLFGGDAVARGFVRAAANTDGAFEFGGSGSGGIYIRSAVKTADGGLIFGGSGSGGLYFRSIVKAVGDPGGPFTFGGDGSSPTKSNHYHVGSGEAFNPPFVFGGDGAGEVTYTRYTGDFSVDPVISVAGTAKHRGATTQREILVAIQERVVSSGAFTLSNSFISIDPGEEIEAPPGEIFAQIVPSRKTVDQGQLEAGGTEADFRAEVFEIRIYRRLALDQPGRANVWTTSQRYSAYSIEKQVSELFQVHDLRDGSGTVIVGEPTRIISIERPIPRGKQGWGVVVVLIEIKYTEKHSGGEA